MGLLVRSPLPRVVELTGEQIEKLRLLKEQKEDFGKKARDADEAISKMLHTLANPVTEKVDYEMDFEGRRIVVHDGGWRR